jgi:hypothetical protein
MTNTPIRTLILTPHSSSLHTHAGKRRRMPRPISKQKIDFLERQIRRLRIEEINNLVKISPKKYSKRHVPRKDLLTGTKTKFKHINIKYPFQARSSISVGVIMTTKKFQSQFADIPIACL